MWGCGEEDGAAFVSFRWVLRSRPLSEQRTLVGAGAQVWCCPNSSRSIRHPQSRRVQLHGSPSILSGLHPEQHNMKTKPFSETRVWVVRLHNTVCELGRLPACTAEAARHARGPVAFPGMLKTGLPCFSCTR